MVKHSGISTFEPRFILVLLVSITALGCSKSGKKRNMIVAENTSNDVPRKNRVENKRGSGRNVVVMRKVNGVYEIPTEVNDETMYFIFDTHAGMISMSNAKAIFLRK